MQSVKKRGKSIVTQNAENALSSTSQVIDVPEKLPPNLILHLKTKPKIDLDSSVTDDLVNDVISYNPSLSTPLAYDPNDNVSFISDSNADESLNHVHDNLETKKCTEVETLCWWCCHKFDDKSLVKLPMRKIKDKYECVGFFCSPECTCAYILDSGTKYGDKWKEFELLHEMLGATKSIRPAPKKELLDIFGGKLDIKTFRGESNWHILYPPMVSLKLQMDDTPTSKDDSVSNFDNTPIHISTLQVDEIQIENLTDKKKRKTKKNNDNETLDRFWGA